MVSARQSTTSADGFRHSVQTTSETDKNPIQLLTPSIRIYPAHKTVPLSPLNRYS
ncbi:hypothetical protein SAMN04489742_0175 [Arthrobacter crystallopoietes]|uniref:Uncharacterized protein n=1 Tax=Crystallibacter crystallopoietes TaxID=37928 RepID=A0A1H0XLQ5_9MICC|nr:hypothetical protein SAMN04489742_0003 [Arthrobacter crystallopoietes]SDQ03783.1 hypothetical protein SAMN04489742_0175 [Arthrobacter crystallopoietes]